MKFGELRQTMAVAMVVDVERIHVTMRNLRESRLLTTGARGVNAPDMTYLDAARILIAHIVNGNPGRAAPRIVRAFGSLPWEDRDFAWTGDPFTLSELVPDSPITTFEEALAALVRVYAECRETDAFRNAGRRLRNGSFDLPRCVIEIHEEDNWAFIRMNEAAYSFAAPSPPICEWSEDQDADCRLGRQSVAFVNQAVISHIAEGFATGNTEAAEHEGAA